MYWLLVPAVLTVLVCLFAYWPASLKQFGRRVAAAALTLIANVLIHVSEWLRQLGAWMSHVGERLSPIYRRDYKIKGVMCQVWTTTSGHEEILAELAKNREHIMDENTCHQSSSPPLTSSPSLLDK